MARLKRSTPHLCLPIALAAIIALAVASSDVSAATRVNRRQNAQRARIVEGVANGSLTRQETRKLRREQRHVRRVERRARADGTLTRKERRRLERKQNRTSRHIFREKHDRQER